MINNSKPKALPIPEDKHNTNKTGELLGEIHYFTLTQEETDDEFTASVKTLRNGFELHVGGKELHGCLIINIICVDFPDLDSMVEAFLNVTYSENRNIINDLSKGIGTITLMRTAISFAFTYFKIDDFVLKDISTFICSPKPAILSPIITVEDGHVVSIQPSNTYEISLPALYILKYGHSWFQKHVNSRFYNKKLRINIAKYKQFCADKHDWNYLYNTYILPEFRAHKMTLEGSCKDKTTILKEIQHIKSVLYNSWSKTNCYRDFILDVITEDNQCYYLMGWVDKIFHEIVNGGFYEVVDNVILHEEFQIIQGLNVSYIKTTYWENKEKEEDLAIKTLHKNKEYTMILGGRQENVLFTRIWNRRPNPKDDM
jgi:hypothetical protein